MAVTRFTLTGDRELQKLFNELPIGLSNSIMKQIGRKGGKLIVKEARSRVKVVTGDLKRSLAVINVKSRGALARVVVGARVKRGGGRLTSGFHAPFVAFGTDRAKVRRVPLLGQWIQEAAGRKEGQVQQIMFSESQKIIDRRVQRLLR